RVRAVPPGEDRPAVRASDDRNGPRGGIPAAQRVVRFRPRTLRGRLTLIFALVTVALSALVGVLVDKEYRSALNSALDETLETRFLAAVEEIHNASTGKTVKPVIPDAESFAQVIDANGDVVAASPRVLRHHRVINRSELEEARDHLVTFVRDAGP